jgi:alpha/beta superfamily hydrolase
MEWIRSEFRLPIIFAGFSFGAATGMRVACSAGDVPAIISLGTPFSAEGRLYNYDFLKSCEKPKLFVSGGEDQYASRAQLQGLTAAVPNSSLVIVDGVDHFFAGKLDEMRSAIEAWVRSQSLAG